MKHLYKFSLLILALLLPTTALAHDFEVDGIYYNINGNEATITSSSNSDNKYTGDVTIPATVTYNGSTYIVTTIGYRAFYDCRDLSNVSISYGVDSIGDNAFTNCSSLTSIDIPISVTTIGALAFSGCSSLTSITIPNSVISISCNTFYGTPWYDNQPDGLVYAGLVAYGYKGSMPSDTSITLREGTVGIASGAFSWFSGLTSITIPNSVIYIGYAAFYECNILTEIYSLALEPPTIEPLNFNYYEGKTLFVPEIALEAYKAAEYWNEFNNIVGMPYTFEVDGTSYHATTLSTASVIANNDEATLYTGNVVIPDSVTYEGMTFAVTGIENNAFDGCFELASVLIPNSVETIGEQAFQGCTGLTSVTIGSGVTTIGAKAFNYCNMLETIKCIGTVPPVMASTDCFSTAAYNHAQLLVPCQFVEAYNTADYWYKFAHIDGWGSAGRGDIDGDGVVSINDVTRMIDAILTGDNEGVYFESADVNSNGRLDIGDVTTIIDMLLNDIE